jgi:hypothetical protein
VSEAELGEECALLHGFSIFTGKRLQVSKPPRVHAPQASASFSVLHPWGSPPPCSQGSHFEDQGKPGLNLGVGSHCVWRGFCLYKVNCWKGPCAMNYLLQCLVEVRAGSFWSEVFDAGSFCQPVFAGFCAGAVDRR